jgi:ankyrin repeat protein
LHWAIHNQNIEIVSFLLMKFTDPSIETIDQYTPLQLAVVHRNLELVKMLMNQPKVDPNKLTAYGTALHLAVYHNCIPIVKYLIDNGAAVDILDKDGKKAHSLAQSNEVTQIFQDH